MTFFEWFFFSKTRLEKSKHGYPGFLFFSLTNPIYLKAVVNSSFYLIFLNFDKSFVHKFWKNLFLRLSFVKKANKKSPVSCIVYVFSRCEPSFRPAPTTTVTAAGTTRCRRDGCGTRRCRWSRGSFPTLALSVASLKDWIRKKPSLSVPSTECSTPRDSATSSTISLAESSTQVESFSKNNKKYTFYVL